MVVVVAATHQQRQSDRSGGCLVVEAGDAGSVDGGRESLYTEDILHRSGTWLSALQAVYLLIYKIILHSKNY